MFCQARQTFEEIFFLVLKDLLCYVFCSIEGSNALRENRSQANLWRSYHPLRKKSQVFAKHKSLRETEDIKPLTNDFQTDFSSLLLSRLPLLSRSPQTPVGPGGAGESVHVPQLSPLVQLHPRKLMANPMQQLLCTGLPSLQSPADAPSRHVKCLASLWMVYGQAIKQRLAARLSSGFILAQPGNLFSRDNT